MKLSAKQKEVIRLMREGKLLTSKINPRYSCYYIKDCVITNPTFSVLSNKGLIQFDSQVTRVFTNYAYYKLTELGKTINID